MLNIYALYDSQIKGYMVPFTMKADGQAKRAMIDALQNNNTDVGKHPEDFSLFRLGSFDEELGSIDVCEPPVRVCNCWELINSSNEEK